MKLAHGDRSIHFALGFTHDLGPRCRTCQNTEAHCAHTAGCCTNCTHFSPRRFGRATPPKPLRAIDNPATPICDECGRRVSPRGRPGCPGLCAQRQRNYWRGRARALAKRKCSIRNAAS